MVDGGHTTGDRPTAGWLIPDHLGSTNVTANADGTMQSEMRYAPFGETRYTNGVTPSEYRYTGQLSQPELGLYYYVARWYDPQLGRFIQADTVVPNPGDAKAYDRYSYVLNNPINMNDPSGHCYNFSSPACVAYWQAKTTYAINYVYDITIDSAANFSTNAVIEISHAIKSIEVGVNNVSNGNGLNWIRKNLGGTTITNIKWNDPLRKESHVYENTIYLPRDFETKGWRSLDGTIETMIIHEFSHVWDNNSNPTPDWGNAAVLGGGYSDHLMSFIDAEPRLVLRFIGGIKYNENRWKIPLEWSDRNEYLDYGNNSTADYFANTFTGVITSNKDTPGLSGIWMAVLIDLTK